MITKDYKCNKCGKIIEIVIETVDITGNKGIVNQKILSERINEERFCECGGNMIPQMSANKWINFSSFMRGKISRRTA